MRGFLLIFHNHVCWFQNGKIDGLDVMLYECGVAVRAFWGAGGGLRALNAWWLHGHGAQPTLRGLGLVGCALRAWWLHRCGAQPSLWSRINMS